MTRSISEYPSILGGIVDGRDIPISITIQASDLRKIMEDMVRDIRQQIIEEMSRANDKQYLTRKEVMSLLGVSETTLVRWSNEHYLVPSKVGAKCMYSAADVYRLMQK